MQWYLKVLKNYAGFSGRARRKEYWMFVLINMIIAFALGLLDGLLGFYDSQAGIGLLSGLYMLGIVIPSLAVAVRRLHDTGRSGWWLLIVLVPLIGGLVLLVFLVLDSEPGTNQYGPNPKQGTAPSPEMA